MSEEKTLATGNVPKADSLRPKSVAEFLDGQHHFLIPSFQRGYRWGDKQVRDLLDDMLSFVRAKSTVSYFLQPIVVRHLQDGAWEVLDGQQRLTTMLLVLKNLIPYLSPKKAERVKNRLYGITYAARKNLDLDRLDPQSDIDSYHLYHASKLIKDWMAHVSENYGAAFDRFAGALFDSDSDQKVQFIWYVVPDPSESVAADTDERVEAIKIFNRLNKGKIGLTSSELIKALFILACKKSGDRWEAESLKISMVWNAMECRFADDGFWCFISDKSADPLTRMDLLFDFVSGAKSGTDGSYRWFQQRFDDDNDGGTFLELWNRVKSIFDMLVHWYEDTNIYNYVGYLVANGKSPSDIHAAIEKAKKDADDWDEEQTYCVLRGMISGVLKHVADIETVTYEDSDSVRKILLLFNVDLYRTSGLRFDFAAYRQENWDIEHVDSQTTNTMQDIDDKIIWLECVAQSLSAESSKDAKELLSESRALIEAMTCDRRDSGGAFLALYGKVSKYYSRGTGFDEDASDKDSLGNLVLLDSGTNRGYGNAPFPYKRNCIIERDRNGLFVPIGTKNVFLKYYSGVAASAMDAVRWHTSDMTCYMEELHKRLNIYLNGGAK